MIIYTAIYGGYDRLRAPECDQSARMVCYTDSDIEPVEPWEIVRAPAFHTDPRRASRWMKILGYPKLEPSVWVDSSIVLRRDPSPLVEEVLAYSDMGIFRHRNRDCVYQEIDACIRRGKDSRETLERQRERYLREGMPRGWGLYECGLVVRRPTPWVERFCQDWWGEYLRGSCRDQVALPYVCWSTWRNPKFIEGDLWDSDYTRVERTRGGAVLHERSRV